MTNPLEFSSYAIPMKTEINYPQTSSAEGYLPQAETVYNKQPQKQLADTICNPQILSAESHPPEARTVYSTSHPRTLPAICKGIHHMQEQPADIIPADIIQRQRCRSALSSRHLHTPQARQGRLRIILDTPLTRAQVGHTPLWT